MGGEQAKRRAKNRIKWGLRKLFEVGQRFGVDILPRHFYSSVPDIRNLRKWDGWKKPLDMSHVRGADVEGQFQFLKEICDPWREKLGDARVYDEACREAGEEGYNLIDGQALYCFARSKKPGKVVQVGCGVSTAILLAAVRDAGTRATIRCIEPYPSEFLKRLASPKAIELVPKKAQEVELEALTDLGAGDLLFVDSTHSVMPGSEVNRIMLEVIPRLVPKCFVHFHDIYFPYDYQRGLMTDELFFSSETALLMALLTDNPKLEILASLSMMQHAKGEGLKEIFPAYRPGKCDEGLAMSPGEGHYPSAIYLETC